MGAWFIGNQLSASMISTGAFEIYVNENLEFSKLNSGRMPDLRDIQEIINKYKIGE